jgi:hypothetical protein
MIGTWALRNLGLRPGMLSAAVSTAGRVGNAVINYCSK